MSDNRYMLAGWLAIAQAVILPLSFVTGMVQNVLGMRMFDYHAPTLGPADLLMAIFTGLFVYTASMFRRLLNERYDFHDLDTLIILSIWWSILFQLAVILLKTAFLILGPLSNLAMGIIVVVFFTIAMSTIGIIDILIGMRLLRLNEVMNNPLRIFAYLAIAAGVLEVTIILTPLALILMPISCVVLGVVFLREEEEVEFV